MPRWLEYFLILLLFVSVIGCGGSKDRNRNSGLDRPVPGDQPDAVDLKP